MVTHKQIWWDKESLTQHIITQHLPFQIFIQLTYHVSLYRIGRVTRFPKRMRAGDASLTFSSSNSLLISFVFGGLLVTSVPLVTIMSHNRPLFLI